MWVDDARRGATRRCRQHSGGRHEGSSPTIRTPGGRGRRPCRAVAARPRASLSGAAAALDRGISGRRRRRHRRAHHGAVVVGAARPAGRGREQAGRRQQYLHPGGGALRPPTATRCCSFRRPPPSTSRCSRRCRSTSLRDIAPVAGLIDFPLVMVANPSLPAKTVAELVAHAKANPGKISIASFGTGSTSHVAGELFKMMTGVNMIHVPYRGGAPMVDRSHGRAGAGRRSTC